MRPAIVLFLFIFALTGMAAHAEPVVSRKLLSNSGTASVAAATDARTVSAVAALRKSAAANGKVRVIVGLRVPFAPEGILPEAERQAQRGEISTASGRLMRSMMERKMSNPSSIRSLGTLPFVAMEVSGPELEFLMRQSDVLTIAEDRMNSSNLLQSNGIVGAPAAWSAGYSGAGQTIAILDSGVDGRHPFLSGKVVSEACYSGGGNARESLCPGTALQTTTPGSGRPCLRLRGCDHGTHVAGIAAGSNSSFSGVARDAKVIAIQVFSKSRRGITAWDSDIIAALQRVYELRNTYAIAAVNLSLGRGRFYSTCDYENPAMTAAISTLSLEGIATVISSGNDGYTDSMQFPACISGAISVGATFDSAGDRYCRGIRSTVDQVACFSNSASFLKLLAPGLRINSSVPGTRYKNFVGTSMAAPHVAGAWAILKQKTPWASVEDVLRQLAHTGKMIIDYRGGTAPPRIDIPAALGLWIAEPTVDFERHTYKARESDASISIRVDRTTKTGRASVRYWTEDWFYTTAGMDYSHVEGTLNFEPGEDSKTITVPIVDDPFFSFSQRSFRVNLGSPSGVKIHGNSVLVDIEEDESPSPISFERTDYAVSESDFYLKIPLVMRGPVEYRSTVMVKVTSIDGTAVYGVDFNSVSNSGLYDPDKKEGYVFAFLNKDNIAERNKNFKIKLSQCDYSDCVPVSEPSEATIIIIDDD